VGREGGTEGVVFSQTNQKMIWSKKSEFTQKSGGQRVSTNVPRGFASAGSLG
jgi:hypothetical protein